MFVNLLGQRKPVCSPFYMHKQVGLTFESQAVVTVTTIVRFTKPILCIKLLFKERLKERLLSHIHP